VLKALKRRSLAKLRKQVEPVEPAALARFLTDWQGIARPRRGLDALLGAVEQLQGAPLVASSLEREILAARIQPLRPSDLDVLFSAGELIWRGVEPVGSRDGRIALYLTDHYRLLAPPPKKAAGELASGFGCSCASGGIVLRRSPGYDRRVPDDLLKALWDLVWAGEVTNDTLAPLRSYLRGAPKDDRRIPRMGQPFRSRRIGPSGSEGRWSLLPEASGTPTERATALAQACSRGMAWSPARQCMRRTSPVGSPPCTRSSRPWRKRDAHAEATSSRASAGPSSPCPAPRSGCALSARRPASRSRKCSRHGPGEPVRCDAPWPRVDGEGRAQRAAGAR